MEIKVEYVPMDSIKPYEGNAKEHSQEQIEQIKQSIKEFGFNDPCAVWNGEIVEGHGRYEAAKQLGYTEIPVIRLDDLTDEQRRAYGLIHNQLTMNSGFDAEALEAELASISDIDMSVYAFDVDEILGDDKDDERVIEPKEKNLQGYQYVHYMVTVDINQHDKIINLINQLKEIDGVEVESTLNG